MLLELIPGCGDGHDDGKVKVKGEDEVLGELDCVYSSRDLCIDGDENSQGSACVNSHLRNRLDDVRTRKDLNESVRDWSS